MTKGLNDKLAAAAKAKKKKALDHQLKAFQKQVRGQTGKALTSEQVQILIALAEALK